MVDYLRCTICGKSIENSVQYVGVNCPTCSLCWENFFEGSRYLPAQTRHKLQGTLREITMEVPKLERIIQDQKQEKDHLLSEILLKTNTLENEKQKFQTQCWKLRKSLARVYYERCGIDALYHLTHCENLASILEMGILCYNLAKFKNIPYRSIANPAVQEKRETKIIEDKSAHYYVPLFFSRRTPMLYQIKSEGKFRQEELVYVCINIEILSVEGIYFSDGNVAAYSTNLYSDIEDLGQLEWDIIQSGSWYENDEKKEKVQAEVLVPAIVNPSWFQKIVVYNNAMKDKLEDTLQKLSIPVEVNRNGFYF